MKKRSKIINLSECYIVRYSRNTFPWHGWVFVCFTAPPSYSECVFGKTNIKDDEDTEYTQGQMNFAPAYTYYDWSKQSQFKWIIHIPYHNYLLWY